jgi:hypothetical protein
MEYPRTQKGNTRGLTVGQHVFPAKSLRRFANSSDLVSLIRKGSQNIIMLKPSDAIFCAKRAWDQRAERGYMKSIEDRFQGIAEEIVAGRRSLEPSQQEVASNFYALWRLRAHHREDSVPDHPMRGVTPDQLTLDQRENLEMHGYIVGDSKGALPGRMVAGIVIQRDIDRVTDQLKNENWGVIETREGELIVPDEFGTTSVVPVTPTLCLIAGCEDGVLVRPRIFELNRAAIAASRKYLVARDFSRCPM